MKPKIAVFSGPTATIQNSPPLVTSNKARRLHGLPVRLAPDGAEPRFDPLRPQRLAAPVTVYVEQFSAHPLEREMAELYGPPDGYVDANGAFHEQRTAAGDKPVYTVTLEPGDGLYPLPYMARQADGSAWDDSVAYDSAPTSAARQSFYPDASRIVEEIDRLGISNYGMASMLASVAEFDFYRPAPSGGYRKGVSAAERTDAGAGDIAPETWGEDFFMYYPRHLRRDPSMVTLVRATNTVCNALASGAYAGALWLEGSPTTEESIYWLGLLADTTVPIVAHSAQRAHQTLSGDGDRNIVDGVNYILSSVWAGPNGKNMAGAVMIVDEMIFTARDVQKADARPGGYVATGGHGGVLGTIGEPGPPELTFAPVKRHTYTSAVNRTQLPKSAAGVRMTDAGIVTVDVPIKSGAGDLLESAMPKVTMVKYGRYLSENFTGSAANEIEVLARIEKNLRDAPLSGFVGEGGAPFGNLTESQDAALKLATLSGIPVVKVGRGNAEGVVPRFDELSISGNNLTATKARLLLMASLLKLGALPPAVDPRSPTPAELDATRAKVQAFQEIFDSH
jgi:hypothetical protein